MGLGSRGEGQEDKDEDEGEEKEAWTTAAWHHHYKCCRDGCERGQAAPFS